MKSTTQYLWHLIGVIRADYEAFVNDGFNSFDAMIEAKPADGGWEVKYRGLGYGFDNCISIALPMPDDFGVEMLMDLIEKEKLKTDDGAGNPTVRDRRGCGQ